MSSLEKDVVNISGKKVGSASLDESVFGEEVNEHLHLGDRQVAAGKAPSGYPQDQVAWRSTRLEHQALETKGNGSRTIG